MSLSIAIITGQSGSGKTTAMRTLEDHGYFCVDNIPTALVEELLKIQRKSNPSGHLALAMDTREPHFVEEFPALLESLRSSMDSVRLVYLESTEECLVRRFSETRRAHPLDNGMGLRDAIRSEQLLLGSFRELADETIDTSQLTPHTLRAIIIKQIAGSTSGDHLHVALLSFGFKHGLPLSADMVFDVRFLPNPYFVPAMRDQTGLNPEVRQYVLDFAESQDFVTRAMDLLAFLIPHYIKEGKRYLTIAIGCTGGQHRSVSIACELAEKLAADDRQIDLRHRDIVEQKK